MARLSDYPPDVLEELRRTRPEFSSLITQGMPPRGPRAAVGPAYTRAPTSAFGLFTQGTPRRYEQRGDIIIDNQTGVGYSLNQAPPEALAEVKAAAAAAAAPGAAAGAPGATGKSSWSDIAWGQVGGRPGSPGARPSASGLGPGTSELPSAVAGLPIWWPDEHEGVVQPPGTHRSPTWQEKDAHDKAKFGAAGGLPSAVTNPITGVRRGKPFLGTNMPPLSPQARNLMLPSERGLWDQTVRETGGIAEDVLAYGRRLGGAPRASGVSMSGAPRARRRY